MQPHHLKISKCKESIEWYIHGKLRFYFNDYLEDGYLQEEHTTIRLMVPTKGLCDNYKIHEVLKQ